MLQSSIWLESHETVRIWFTLLMLADAKGFVSSSVKGLSHTSRVCLEKTVEALNILESPDPDSKSSEHEGRRLERVEGGFLLLNHAKYRRGDPFSPAAERKRKSRSSVTSCDAASASVLNKKRWRIVPDDWEPKQVHRDKAAALGVDFEAELDKFRNWEYKQPKTDADRAFHTWLRNARPTKPVKGGISWGIE